MVLLQQVQLLVKLMERPVVAQRQRGHEEKQRENHQHGRASLTRATVSRLGNLERRRPWRIPCSRSLDFDSHGSALVPGTA